MSDVIVMKIGGSVAGEDAAALDVIASLHDAGHPIAVVHGGGPLATEWAGRLGLETRFVRGLRVTDAAMRDVALATFAGLANKRIVAALLARGVPAIGVSGIDAGMLRAEREDAELGLVGRVTLVDSALLEDLVDTGRVPVVAPAALDASNGEILNVNGDSAAGAIAASLAARLLVFVTDVPGVRAKDGKVIGSLDIARAKALVDDGTIEGGMVPKVEACLVAAGAGCRSAIVAARGADAIEKLLAGERVGTVFEAAAAPASGASRGEAVRETLARKHHRQQALLRLVQQQRLATQQELVRGLKSSGFPATQATVSRDVVELGLVKVARDGAHVYAPPSAVSQGGGTERLRRFCEDYPVEAAVAANIVVLRSLPGTANALGAALDASGMAEIIGTLAGDDTVFVATSTDRHARSLLTRLVAFGIARKEKS